MRHPLKNVHNVGKETWPPAGAGNRVTNNDLATQGGPYTLNPGAQALSGRQCQSASIRKGGGRRHETHLAA